MIPLNIVVTELAVQKQDITLCWKATSEAEASNLVAYLQDHGIIAWRVSEEYFKDWSEQ
jgi:hypothetical protein